VRIGGVEDGGSRAEPHIADQAIHTNPRHHGTGYTVAGAISDADKTMASVSVKKILISTNNILGPLNNEMVFTESPLWLSVRQNRSLQNSCLAQ